MTDDRDLRRGFSSSVIDRRAFPMPPEKPIREDRSARMKTRARMWMGGLAILSWTIAGTISAAADVPTEPPVEARERVEAEAIGQAGEADRLFKAGDYAAALPLYEAERGSRAAL